MNGRVPPSRTEIPTFSRRVALGIAPSLLAGACRSHRTPAEQRAALAARNEGDVVIAVAWPWERRRELRFGDGLDFAVEEVNASNGIKGRKLRLQRFDDGESLHQGTLVAHQIAAATEIVAVIGHLQSYVTAPVAPIYELAGLVLVAPTATEPALTSQGYRRVFRATFTDRDTGRQMAEYAGRHFRRIAIYYVRNTYGRGLANAFEERASEIGLSVAARRSYDPGDQVTPQTFAGAVREWNSLDLDAIFLAGEVPSAAAFVVQARAEGLKVPILGGDAMSSPALLTEARNAAEGMILASFFHADEPRDDVKRFVAAFQKRFGATPDAGAALGYDAVHVLARAMRHAGTGAPDRVAEALHTLPAMEGVAGALQFGADGSAVRRRIVKVVVRGTKFEYLREGVPAAAQAEAKL